MSAFSLFTSNYTIIQGDMYHIDGSQTTTNKDSFNVITTFAGQSAASAPESPLESTPRASFDDVSSLSADTSTPHQQSGGILQTESAGRRTSTSSSMSVEDIVYPPSRVFTQDLNFQRAAHRHSNRSTGSLEAPEFLGTSIRNSPAEEKLCQRVFNKLKGWFNGFLGCLS